MRLLLVDGSNIVMRAAFGGDIPPAQAIPIASGLISRAAIQIGATHMVIALDSPVPSWRKIKFPEYKAHRSVDTSPWFQAAHEYWVRLGWYVEDCGGFEADDIIATLAYRARPYCPVVALSNDSDLLTLTGLGATILKPMNGGQFLEVTANDVCAKYDIRSPALLPSFKALTGEPGDNIPGVPGIGPVRAAKLLHSFGDLDRIIAAGVEGKCPRAALVAQHAQSARLAFDLVALSYRAPIPPITPRACTFKRH